MLSSAEENNAALVSPLLRFGEEGDDGDRGVQQQVEDFPSSGAVLNALGGGGAGETGRSSFIMETSTGSAEFESRMMANHPGARRMLFRFAQVHTLADALPSVFQIIATSGKLSGLAFLGVYLVFILLWLPFWLLSFLVTEYGVYALTLGAIFYFGRVVIRMIAFPGASNKVVSEVESEFAKYSVRMLVAAANCLRELAQAVESTGGRTSSDNKSGGTSGSSIANYEIIPLWKRAKSYRDRALGVYLEVLNYIYDQPAQVPVQPSNQRTRFGTNRIAGDIGNLSGLTVRGFVCS